MIDLKVLIPEKFLRSERIEQFLEVLNETVQELEVKINGVESLMSFKDIETQYLSLLMDNIGLPYEPLLPEESNRFMAIEAKDFIEIKGSNLFFDNLLKLYNVSAVIEDMGDKIVNLSNHGKLSYGYKIQDAKRHRDGVLEVFVSNSDFVKVQNIIQKYLMAGFYAYYTITGYGFISLTKCYANGENNTVSLGSSRSKNYTNFCLLENKSSDALVRNYGNGVQNQLYQPMLLNNHKFIVKYP